MDALLSDDEVALRDEMRKFLAAESSPALVRAMEKDSSHCARDLWKKMGDLGWLGVSLPERCGGQALPITSLGFLFEEAGRYLVPVPLHASLVAAQLLAKYGEGHQLEWVSRVAKGDAILSYAVQASDGSWNSQPDGLSGRRVGSVWMLNGERGFVDDFAVSDRCLVVFRAEDGEITAALVDPRAAGISHEVLVPTAKDGECKVTFRDVEIAASEVVRSGRDLARDLCDLAALSLAAQLAGAARRDMEFAVDHAKLREAFEQPIGSFQVIQHMLVDMLIAVDGVELLAREAFWRMARGLSASVEASQAKAFASERCVVIARGSQQIHGGMGFMLEFDLHLWYRRIASWALRAGTSLEHRRLVAHALLDKPGKLRLASPLTV